MRTVLKVLNIHFLSSMGESQETYPKLTLTYKELGQQSYYGLFPRDVLYPGDKYHPAEKVIRRIKNIR